MRVENRKTYRATPSERSAYIGRPTLLGNPFLLGRDGDRSEVINRYRVWLGNVVKFDGPVRSAFLALVDVEVLVCWCAPSACHGDVLAAELADTCDRCGDLHPSITSCREGTA